MRKLSRDEWIDGAFRALTAGGIEGLRVEPLARRLGVTKGSFYHHFENRRALHLAILEQWERLGTAQVIDQVEDAKQDPEGRLRQLIGRTFELDPFAEGIETGIRSWAAADDVVAKAVARVDKRRIRYVVGLLRQAGIAKPLAERRARLLYRVLLGELLWRSAGGPASSKRELDEVATLLLVDER